MSGRKPPLSHAEIEQFRAAMAGVAPLRAQPRAQPASRPPRPARKAAGAPREATQATPAQPTWHDPSPQAIHATPDQLSYCCNGINAALLRRLKQTPIPAHYCLDLHGMSVAQARAALGQLLTRAQRAQQRHVGIIHGKGLQSGQRGPVIKAHVRCWLQQCEQVLAFVSAPAQAGGSGAVHVRLRR